MTIMIDILQKYWPMLLRGAGVTLYISIIGTIVGTIIGLLVGVIRTIPRQENRAKRYFFKFINILLSVYVEVFRGTPMIVQSFVIFYGSKMLFGVDMDRTAAAILIVSINTGAYMSEIVRGGIVTIDRGQFEAAHALGMNHIQTMLNIVLPQVIRNILPATGNEFVINIKDTSVLNVIAVTELFFQTKTIAGMNYRYFEAYTITAIIYFIMTFGITTILRFIERKLDGPENYIPYANQMQVKRPEDIEAQQQARKIVGK